MKLFDSFLHKNVQKATVIAKETVETEVRKSVDEKIDTICGLIMAGISIYSGVKRLLKFIPEKHNDISGTTHHGEKTLTITCDPETASELIMEVLRNDKH